MPVLRHAARPASRRPSRHGARGGLALPRRAAAPSPTALRGRRPARLDHDFSSVAVRPEVAAPGAAPFGIYRQQAEESGEPEERPEGGETVTVEVNPEETLVPGFGFVLPPIDMMLDPGLSFGSVGATGSFRLTPPSFGSGRLPLGPSGSIFDFPDLGSGEGPVLPPLPPGVVPPLPSSGADPSASSDAPSRLSVLDHGRFSLGLRLGFPSAEELPSPDAAPSAHQEFLRRAEIIDQLITGRVPGPLERIDPSLAAGVIWGIFSTHIAPDFARSITESLSPSTGAGGLQLELDATLITDFSNEIGGGLSLQGRF